MIPSAAPKMFLIRSTNRARTFWMAPTIVVMTPLKISRMEPRRSPRPLTIEDMVSVYCFQCSVFLLKRVNERVELRGRRLALYNCGLAR